MTIGYIGSLCFIKTRTTESFLAAVVRESPDHGHFRLCVIASTEDGLVDRTA